MISEGGRYGGLCVVWTANRLGGWTGRGSAVGGLVSTAVGLVFATIVGQYVKGLVDVPKLTVTSAATDVLAGLPLSYLGESVD